MYPFGEADLERVYENARTRSVRVAEILLVDAWTGLRWSELRALRVRDFVEVPLPVLVVQVAEPEGCGGEGHEVAEVAAGAGGGSGSADGAADGDEP